MSDNPLAGARDGTERAGSLAMVLLFAALLAGAAAAFALLPRGAAADFGTALLALFAVAGVFAIFSFAAGLLQFSGEAANDDLAQRIFDSDPEAMIATGADGAFLCANDAFLRLSGASDRANLRSVEQIFARAPGASEAVYRLAQAARAGLPAREELNSIQPMARDAPGRGTSVSGRLPEPMAAPACGPSPGRGTGSRQLFRRCAAPSICSTMRRPDFSPGLREAPFPT